MSQHTAFLPAKTNLAIINCRFPHKKILLARNSWQISSISWHYQPKPTRKLTLLSYQPKIDFGNIFSSRCLSTLRSYQPKPTWQWDIINCRFPHWDGSVGNCINNLTSQNSLGNISQQMHQGNPAKMTWQSYGNMIPFIIIALRMPKTAWKNLTSQIGNMIPFIIIAFRMHKLHERILLAKLAILYHSLLLHWESY